MASSAELRELRREIKDTFQNEPSAEPAEPLPEARDGEYAANWGGAVGLAYAAPVFGANVLVPTLELMRNVYDNPQPLPITTRSQSRNAPESQWAQDSDKDAGVGTVPVALVG